MKLELLISVTSDKITLERKRLIAVEKFSLRIFDGDTTIGQSSILGFLNKIKADKSHADGKGNKQHEFEMEWKPDDKDKTVFSDLRDSKPKDLNLFLYFFIRDDGKLASSQTAVARQARVMVVNGKGKGKDATQIVLVRSHDFDFSS